MKKKCPACANKPHTQDELHGDGIRVFNVNPIAAEKGYATHACTRCGYKERGEAVE